MTIGVVIGAISGYFGGKVDLVLMRVTELFQTVPAFILAILLVATFSPSLLTIILTIGAVSWPPLARLTRAEFLRLRGREFVEAALCQGESTARIVLGHHSAERDLTDPRRRFADGRDRDPAGERALLHGIRRPEPDVLGLHDRSRAHLVIRQAWWTSVFPGLAILMTVLAINLLARACPTSSIRASRGAGMTSAGVQDRIRVRSVEKLLIASPEGGDRRRRGRGRVVRDRAQARTSASSAVSGSAIHDRPCDPLAVAERRRYRVGRREGPRAGYRDADRRALRRLRGGKAAMIFQEPFRRSIR